MHKKTLETLQYPKDQGIATIIATITIIMSSRQGMLHSAFDCKHIKMHRE